MRYGVISLGMARSSMEGVLRTMNDDDSMSAVPESLE